MSPNDGPSGPEYPTIVALLKSILLMLNIFFIVLKSRASIGPEIVKSVTSFNSAEVNIVDNSPSLVKVIAFLRYEKPFLL